MPQGDALQSPYPFKGTTFSESTLGNKKSTRNLKEWVSRTYSPRRQHLQIVKLLKRASKSQEITYLTVQVETVAFVTSYIITPL